MTNIFHQWPGADIQAGRDSFVSLVTQPEMVER
jgi:hypothetical protein